MFKFRLEPLITIRDNTLKECQAELAKAYNERRLCEESIQNVDHQLAEGAEAARRFTQEGQTVNVEYLLGIRRQEMFLLADRNTLTEKLQGIDRDIEIRRNAVVEANKALKTIEKMKEKLHEQYLAEERKQDTKLMDEIAGNRQTHVTQ